MWRRYLAGSLVLAVAATQSVWAESKKKDAENLKAEKNIMETKSSAASYKNAFVIVDSRGGTARGKIRGRLIETNADGIVLGGTQGLYGVPTLSVAYRDIKKIKLGAAGSRSAGTNPNAPIFMNTFKGRLIGEAAVIGVGLGAGALALAHRND